MSRTLTFQVIQDTRFSKTPKQDVLNWKAEIIKEIENLPAIEIRTGPLRKLTFTDIEPPTFSYRQAFYVRKNTRKTTWKDIITIVNNIKIVSYKFI